ncbi:MAG: hypothetical protein MK105_00060 [Crocinitomicaceae bacterium]|nr:hypothetical protein [Crocinitomicaceae bacterium]
MKPHLLLICLLFAFKSSLAQDSDSITVILKISDEIGLDVEEAFVRITQSDDNYEVTSNQNGEAICRLERFGEIKATIKHPLFVKRSITEEIYENTRLDTIYYKVVLTSIRSLNLEEVRVSAPGMPEVIFGSKLKSVQDFEILDNGDVILLAYPKQLKKGSQLLLYNMVDLVKDSIELELEAIELTRDYEGHVYLIHTSGCKQIVVNENAIETTDINLFYYNRYIKPIIGVSEQKMFFSTYDALYPEFDYYFFDVKDSIYEKFATVKDAEMLEEYRAEYRFADMYDPIEVRRKLNAKNYELATGIDAEIYYGRKYFTRTVYYESPFAPMFKVDNSLYLFDYHCDSLKNYNLDGELFSSVSISHDHQRRKLGWQKVLVQDRLKRVIYVLYERGGFCYVNKVNLITGKLQEPIKLNHRYVEGVQIHNGFVYYIYRPFESYQKKHFWREKLPN